MGCVLWMCILVSALTGPSSPMNHLGSWISDREAQEQPLERAHETLGILSFMGLDRVYTLELDKEARNRVVNGITSDLRIITTLLERTRRCAACNGAAAADALVKLGGRHAEGVGVPLSHEEAAKSYRKVVFKYGLVSTLGNGKLCEAVALAMYKLGVCYSLGKGVAMDQEAAAILFSKASGADHPAATHMLADAYDQGAGVEKDVEMAAQLYEKAARLGYPAQASGEGA